MERKLAPPLIFLLLLALSLPTANGDSLVRRPSANDTPLELSPSPSTRANWDCVDEYPTPGDTDYVYLPGAAEPVTGRDVYTLDNPNVPAGATDISVTVYWRARKTRSNIAASGRPLLKVNGVVYEWLTGDSLTTTFTTRSRTWTTNPATGNAWTASEVNAVKAGVRLDVYTEPCAAQCSQLYVVIDYTLAGQTVTVTTSLTTSQTFTMQPKSAMQVTLNHQPQPYFNNIVNVLQHVFLNLPTETTVLLHAGLLLTAILTFTLTQQIAALINLIIHVATHMELWQIHHLIARAVFAVEAVLNTFTNYILALTTALQHFINLTWQTLQALLCYVATAELTTPLALFVSIFLLALIVIAALSKT